MRKCYRKLLVDATSRRKCNDKRTRLHELLLYMYEEQIFPGVKLFFIYSYIYTHVCVFVLYETLYKKIYSVYIVCV